MRTLIVGAGATGGYYGARLAQAGRDVAFLVRPARAAALAGAGLRVTSPKGDLHLPAPATLTAAALAGGGQAFDLVVLSCKAYDLDAAVADLAPAVGPDTLVLPLLNGMRHLDALDAAFGPHRVLGGSCAIAATLAGDGTIRHMSDFASITYGARDGARSERVLAVDALMQGAANVQARLSDRILLEMWEKWVFLATLAGATTLMRAAIGDIVAAPGGRDLIVALHAECMAVAAAQGFAPREKAAAQGRAMLTAEGSGLTASMLRDVENGGRIEADHIVGDLAGRGSAAGLAVPLLDTVRIGLEAYEGRRARTVA